MSLTLCAACCLGQWLDWLIVSTPTGPHHAEKTGVVSHTPASCVQAHILTRVQLCDYAEGSNSFFCSHAIFAACVHFVFISNGWRAAARWYKPLDAAPVLWLCCKITTTAAVISPCIHMNNDSDIRFWSVLCVFCHSPTFRCPFTDLNSIGQSLLVIYFLAWNCCEIATLHTLPTLVSLLRNVWAVCDVLTFHWTWACKMSWGLKHNWVTCYRKK